MGRFLVSVIAGMLVIVGGWYGWLRADTVDALVTDAARGLAPDDALATDVTPEGEAPSGMPTDPQTTISIADTRAGQPCPLPQPTSEGGMDRLMDALDDEPRLEGGDHGGSVALADGRRMFVYGDTIRDPVTISPFMVRNSVLVANGGCVQPMLADDGAAVIPDDPDNTGYWPMSLRAVAVDGGTKVQVITNRVRQTDDGSVFQTLGTSLVTFEVPTDRMPRVVDTKPLAPDPEDWRTPNWGASMWDHDGKTYVFGTASNAAKASLGWSLHVARTDPQHLGDMDHWEYWDGTQWTDEAPDPATNESAQLIPSDHGVSHVLSVFERNGSWYAVSKEGDYHGDALAVWKAPSVTGPWTKHTIRPLENTQGIQRYTPLAHPDFATASGRLLVSWSESPADHARYRTDPELYRPEFDEISLP